MTCLFAPSIAEALGIAPEQIWPSRYR
ncbi:TPA: helix-turn-helix domain-containing protein [Klebsiella pneumoniae]